MPGKPCPHSFKENIMQVKNIAALVAIACAGMSAPAFAAIPTAVLDDANTNGRIISISGASAVQKGFTGIIAKMFTGTPTYFAEKFADASGTDFVAVAGTLTAGTGDWAGKNVIVVYRVKGGSVYGVNSVARADLIEALNVTSGCTVGSTTVAGVTTTSDGSSAKPYVCATTMRAPDAGVSDVAPALFQAPVNTEGETAAAALNAGELGVLTATPIYGMAFGVPVTKNVGAINLNRSALAAIMTGNVGTWDAVDSTESGDIVVCRRVPGSGTQAVYNMYLGNFPCDAANNNLASNIPADRDASAAWDASTRTYTVDGNNGGLVVIENSSSGEVRSCLDAAQTASTTAAGTSGATYTTYGTFDRDGLPVTVKFLNGGTHKAIGTLSMDSLNKSTTSAKWQFRSLDGSGKIVQDTANAAPTTSVGATGKFPTMANIVDGTWDLQGMVSFNLPARTTGAKKAVLDFFLGIAQDPATLNAVNAIKFVAAGVPGGNYTYTTGNVMRASYLGGNQCAPYNRNN